MFRIALMGGVAALSLTACSPVTTAPAVDRAVDAAGVLHVPADYRTTYQGLGAWAIAADQSPGSKELHVVYASPGAAAAYKQTRHFPYGTVLVKEVYDASTAPMTTGTASHATKLKGWFVMVRAANNPHPGDKLWGDGWGWAWFDADKPTKTSSTDYKTDCLTCHEPARKTEFSYVEGYPALAN